MAFLEIHVERVDELAKDLEFLVDLRVGLDAGLVQDRFGREDPHSGSNRQASESDGRASTSNVLPSNSTSRVA